MRAVLLVMTVLLAAAMPLTSAADGDLLPTGGEGPGAPSAPRTHGDLLPKAYYVPHASTGETGETQAWLTNPLADESGWLTVTFDWGDGTTSTDRVHYIPVTGVVARASHAFDRTAVFCVRARATDDEGRTGPWSPCNYHAVQGEPGFRVVLTRKIADLGIDVENQATLTIESGTLRAQYGIAYADVPLIVARANGAPDPHAIDVAVPPLSLHYSTDEDCYQVGGTCRLTLGADAGTSFVKVAELWESRLRVTLDGEVVQEIPIVQVVEVSG